MQQPKEHIELLNLCPSIKNSLSAIKDECLTLFKSKIEVKVPSDMLINELNNTFLHTHYAPLFSNNFPLIKTKHSINFYINSLVTKEKGESVYIQRWNFCED